MKLNIVNPYWIIKGLQEENKALKEKNNIQKAEIEHLNNKIEELKKEQ